MEGNQSRQHRPGVPLPNSYSPMLIQSSLCWASAAPSPFQVVQLDCSHLHGCSTPAATVAILELLWRSVLLLLLVWLTPFCQSLFSLFHHFRSQYRLWFRHRIWPSTSNLEVGICSRLHPSKKVLVFLHCRFRAGSLGGNRYL